MGYTLTTKSQVTLPKPIRDHLKVAPGDAVEFRIAADGSVRVVPALPVQSKAARALTDKFRKLQGIGGHAGMPTDALMSMLRGYDEDDKDPGFTKPAPARRPRK